MAGKYLDEDTLIAIFDQFAPAIYKYALLLCHNPGVGDRIVGDAFAQLLEQFATSKDHRSDPRLHLYQAAYRSIVEYLGDRQTNPSVEPVFSTSDQSPPQNDKVALISALKNKLTDDQRHVVILYFLEDFDVNETAKILGKNVREMRASLKNVTRIIQNHPELLTDSLAALLNKKKRR